VVPQVEEALEALEAWGNPRELTAGGG